MDILRVFNNNVVLARDAQGREVVVTGRGLGFQARPGQPVNQARVARIFVPTEGSGPSQLAALLADIAPETVLLADEALNQIRDELPQASSSATLVALADHLSFALKRVRQGIEVEFPLRAEIAHLYPRELRLAERIVAHVNARVDTPIPLEEAVPIALHLVNAGFNTGDLSKTHQMTGVMKQLFGVIEGAYGHPLDHDGVNIARFVTHLRYFFVRAETDRQLDDGRDMFASSIRGAYPEAYACARRMREILEIRLGKPVTEDETTYLTMHVARLAADERVTASR